MKQWGLKRFDMEVKGSSHHGSMSRQTVRCTEEGLLSGSVCVGGGGSSVWVGRTGGLLMVWPQYGCSV